MSEFDQHTDFESLCSGYVLNTLTKEERKLFEEMLQNATPEQKELYQDLLEVKDELALLSDPVSPPDSLEERIFSNIDGDESANGAKISRMGLPVLIYKVAAALLLVTTIAVSFYMQNLSETVQQQQATITRLTNDLDRKEQLLDVIAAREVKLVVMGGLDPSPDGYGKIIWDTENQQAVLQLANIPAPPADKDYQLWLIKDDQSPISAGVFNFEQSSEELFFKVEQLNEAPSPEQNVFAVTLEPKGGVPQPTGSMFLFGQ